MGTRLELHEILCSVLGSRHVYYQPPESVKMIYPAIVYEHSSTKTQFADNSPYSSMKQYQITVIDKNPDSTIPDAVVSLPMCSFSRHFTAEHLNHDVFTLFY